MWLSRHSVIDATNAVLPISDAIESNGFSVLRQAQVTHTANAVNYVSMTGNITGGASPSIGVQGSDANINFAYLSKGTGVHAFFSGSGARKLLQLTDATSAVNFVDIIPSATGVAPSIRSLGSDTNVGLVLQGKGSGYVSIGNVNLFNALQVEPTSSAVNFVRVQANAMFIQAFLKLLIELSKNLQLLLCSLRTLNLKFVRQQ